MHSPPGLARTRHDTPQPHISLDLVSSRQLYKTPRARLKVLIFVDRLSKYVRIIPTKTDMSAIQFANVFEDTIFKHHGIPETLVSDRDSKFTSERLVRNSI
jgi:hypothetical protein